MSLPMQAKHAMCAYLPWGPHVAESLRGLGTIETHLRAQRAQLVIIAAAMTEQGDMTVQSLSCEENVCRHFPIGRPKCFLNTT